MITAGINLPIVRQLSDGAPPQCLLLPPDAEQPQFLLLLVAQQLTVADFVVLGRKLTEQLTDSMLVSQAVHVGHFVLRQTAHVLVDL